MLSVKFRAAFAKSEVFTAVSMRVQVTTVGGRLVADVWQKRRVLTFKGQTAPGRIFSFICLTPKMKALRSFETSATTCPRQSIITQNTRTPEYLTELDTVFTVHFQLRYIQ